MSSHADCVVITAELDAAGLERVLDRTLRHLQRIGVLGARESMPGALASYPPGAAAELACAPDDAQFLRFARACEVRLGDGASGRGIFGAGESTGDGTRCPACSAPLELGAAFTDAIEDWYRGGRGEMTCPSCGASAPITSWPAERPLGFGCAALVWREWPPLSDAFVSELRAVIAHPLVVVHEHT